LASPEYATLVAPCAARIVSFSTAPSSPDISTLSLHDALPISQSRRRARSQGRRQALDWRRGGQDLARRRTDRRRMRSPVREDERSEEHTSELQSRENLVCRLLLEKKKCRHRRAKPH